ncbi:protein-L-isoaspartate O-methyltransferase [Methyloligella sp. 2.7D]|uniref:protein-L-isoaspartate O-methyltransferase family protein n=1 Tax=unclassified Methyloligella TaxID=2625955 RepID=UPI00157BBACD|nr:protein-L-isoaspartate O-methyltransferase [Methyloligella sp. GL2]QKP77748.1 protein-L-isoaspartate O-methyltransferase [Methyloligella sp. GL2]
MIDFTHARETMVESQLRTAGITDRTLLSTMQSLPREIFVSPEAQPLAYMDGAVPAGTGADGATRYLMEPMVLAKLIQMAEIGESEHILDIGCATGYSLAVLAGHAASVVGLESDPRMAETAAANMQALGISNAKIVTGPLAQGAAADGPYDLIFLSGSVPAVPDGLAAQLKEGGRIAGIIQQGSQGQANLFVKADGALTKLPQFAAGAKPLPGFSLETTFSF